MIIYILELSPILWSASISFMSKNELRNCNTIKKMLFTYSSLFFLSQMYHYLQTEGSAHTNFSHTKNYPLAPPR